MNDDTISRKAAIDALIELSEQRDAWDSQEGFAQKRGIDASICAIEDLPSTERRGRWIFDIDNKGWSWDKPYMCDQCGEWVEKEFNFCPNCGALMVNEDEEMSKVSEMEVAYAEYLND